MGDPVTTGLVGGAAISALGGIIGGNQAADATRDAARSSNALQRYMYDTTRADFAPWRQIGSDAIGQLSQLYGFGGNAPDMGAFFSSPDYQFRFQQGLNALDRSAAARGKLYSGAQRMAVTDYGQRAASQEFGNYFNRLAGMAGLGQSATGQTAAAGQNYANQAGQNYMNAANAQASSYMNTANALSGFGRDVAYGYGRGLFSGGGSGGGSSFGLTGADYAGPWGP